MEAIKSRLRRLPVRYHVSALASYADSLVNGKTIYRVHDGSSWALYWVAHYFNKGMNELGVSAKSQAEYRHLRNQIIHFDSRYNYLANPADSLHPSNHAFLTWYHGDPNEDDFAPLFENLLKRRSRLDGLLVSNATTRNNLIKAGYPADELFTVPIGVDTSVFRPKTDASRQKMRDQLGIRAHEFCIGSFQKDGNGWDEGDEPKLIKGPDVLLETIANVHQNHSELVVLLLGPARGYVKNGLDKLGVRYIHRNLDEYHEVAAYYHALDAYLVTSRSEGGPKGFMESWASGIPVVSTRMGMPADHIVHGENGFIADVADSEKLADYLLTLINTPELIQKMTTRALVDVQQLDWMVLAKLCYDRLYQPILKR